MSKLSVDQKTIISLMSDKKSDFLIPDYQRPYEWKEDQCQTLWDDLFSFSFPDENADNFDDNEEYFLGAIVTFNNSYNKLEVIDGQQRLTTLLLVLRAFYDKFENMEDKNSKLTRESIAKCIWKTDKYGNTDINTLKINSEVATDNDKEEFLEILKTGEYDKNSKSQYVTNYKFFQEKIADFAAKYPTYFPALPANILNNCILLPIEAESQDTALRIFSTLNDRGLPLSDADIFKAQFYKFYKDKGLKDSFIEKWKELEEITDEIFHPIAGTPMDELFTQYMYYLRAKEGIKSSTTEALRKFYERNKYKYLKQEETIDNLESLVFFWKAVGKQDSGMFTDEILKKLFVLDYAPNSMWKYITSVYYMQNRNDQGLLDNDKFSIFLERITAFIFAYAVINPGVNALRTPIYDEMVKIVNNEDITFTNHKFNQSSARSFFENYNFTNNRAVTRSMITWYAFTFDNQPLLSLDEKFDVEHVFSKKRQEMDGSLLNVASLESLGNKVLLEKSINISASDYHFDDKKKIYSGESRRGHNKNKSKIIEIEDFVKREKFDEGSIIERNTLILDKFVDLLKNENLLAG